MAERCNGTDPAHHGLKCYLDKGHESRFVEECEFTDATGELWRERALKAEKKLSGISWQNSDGSYR